ncbi:hypothetical protein TSACC_2559 [Terrimicrobium sacchariphilum]|uniref:Uncharacterized protein n=1 Tax=Terrimicrobium sacchariphilum TaxID=690879 RepID=A0A146G3Y6_TERSA|nr:hypothetical protein TSACC_2559 [Terrimicrobium sacchariphilum]
MCDVGVEYLRKELSRFRMVKLKSNAVSDDITGTERVILGG